MAVNIIPDSISVVMATHNGEKYIQQQIDSIITQLNENDELIISDDASTDGTLLLLEAYKQFSFVKVLCNQKFGSPIFNFEHALRYASKDYIFLSDQDDIWLPNKVAVMKKYLSTCNLVLSDCSIINENNEIIRQSFFEFHKSKSGIINNIVRNSYMGNCMAFRREILSKILPFPKTIPMHDMWIGIMCELYYGKVKFIPIQLSLYRRHTNNVSAISDKFRFDISLKIKYRINILYNIMLRAVKYAI